MTREQQAHYAENEAEAKRLTDGASYIASRGHEQLPELKRWIEAASGADWMRRVHLLLLVARPCLNSISS